MDTFFLEGPVGLQNPGAMTKGDLDWYKAALLKPGGFWFWRMGVF